MVVLAYILSGLSLLMGLLFIIYPRPRSFMKGMVLWFPKLAAGTLSLCWAILGAAGAVIGWVHGALWAIPIGSSVRA